MICLRSTYHVSNCGNKELHCFMLSLRPGYYFILKIGISVPFSKEGHLCDFAHKASQSMVLLHRLYLIKI